MEMGLHLSLRKVGSNVQVVLLLPTTFSIINCTEELPSESICLQIPLLWYLNNTFRCRLKEHKF